MALEQTEFYYDYVKDPQLTVRLLRSQLKRIGGGSDDVTAWVNGYARLWIDDPASPYVYGNKVLGTPILNPEQQRAEQVNSWTEMTPEEKRDQITLRIDSQIFAPSAPQLVEDAFAARAVEATSGGASDKRSDLEDTNDADLDSFDATIVPTPLAGTGYVEAKQTTYIDILDPWVGAPENIYGQVVYLEVLSETGAEGAEARVHLFGNSEVPDNSVLPLTRDAGNPKIWYVESQQGRLWSDPNQTASMRLLWANGSIPVNNTVTVQGGLDGDGRFVSERNYSVVRYGGA